MYFCLPPNPFHGHEIGDTTPTLKGCVRGLRADSAGRVLSPGLRSVTRKKMTPHYGLSITNPVNLTDESQTSPAAQRGDNPDDSPRDGVPG